MWGLGQGILPISCVGNNNVRDNTLKHIPLHKHALFDMIGSLQELYVVRKTQHGIYLAKTQPCTHIKHDSYTNVLLPNAYVSGNERIGDSIQVFLYTDSNDRIVATTQKPTAMLDSITLLPIKASNEHGLFLDIGLAKDIFMPTKSPQNYMSYTHIVVRITRDKMHRLIAKKDITPLIKPCKTQKLLHKKVSLWTLSSSHLGVLCVVLPYYHYGMIYHNTLQKQLTLFSQYEAKVVKIRSDGKLDLVLLRDKDHLLAMITALNANSTYFCVNDAYAQELSMSKKGLKKELSMLLTQKRIIFVPNCGYCTKESTLAKAYLASKKHILK